MTLYEKIDDLRQKNGMTWAYLNKEIGGYRGKLTEMKKDKTTLTDSEITILADRLRTTKDYLLGCTDDPSPAEGKKEPTGQMNDDISGVDNELVRLLCQLTPDEVEKVGVFVQGLLAARKA